MDLPFDGWPPFPVRREVRLRTWHTRGAPNAATWTPRDVASTACPGIGYARAALTPATADLSARISHINSAG